MPPELAPMRVALVTGAGSGLGLAVARHLLAEGWQVAAHYRASAPVDLAREFGEARCRSLQADFLDPSAPDRLWEEALAWGGRVDAVVNSAALIEKVPLAELSQPLLARTFQVNATAPLLLSRRAVAHMLTQGGGRLVSVSSIGVKFHGSPETLHYMTSKAALEAGTLALAKHAASGGVLVNVVRAGVMLTPGMSGLARDLAAREKLIPLGRAAEPAEVAMAIGFLVGPANTYITGCVVPVAGGE